MWPDLSHELDTELIPQLTWCLISSMTRVWLTLIWGVPRLVRWSSLSLHKAGRWNIQNWSKINPSSGPWGDDAPCIFFDKIKSQTWCKTIVPSPARGYGSTGTASMGGRVPPGPCSESLRSKRAIPCATDAGSPRWTPSSWEVMWWRSTERCEKFCDIRLVQLCSSLGC